MYTSLIFALSIKFQRMRTQAFILLQAPLCEHAFCRSCINEWISRQPTCPVDRQAITTAQLRPVPRILRNLLSRLVIHLGPKYSVDLNYTHVSHMNLSFHQDSPSYLGAHTVPYGDNTTFLSFSKYFDSVRAITDTNVWQRLFAGLNQMVFYCVLSLCISVKRTGYPLMTQAVLSFQVPVFILIPN